MNARSILIVEDEHALGSALALLVRRMGHLPTLEASGSAGLKRLTTSAFDAVVLDIGLPDINGLELLEKIRKSGNPLPVLVITAHATLRHAIDSQKSGATDYLTKPLDMERFRQTLDAMLAPVLDLGGRASSDAADSPGLIGSSPSLRQAFIGIARACACDIPVLISGPAGTGKSLAARIIHSQGRHGQLPLKTIDCAAIRSPQDLSGIEGPGTLLLERVEEMPRELQSTLANQLAGAGGSFPLRLLATISCDPLQAVGEGTLREDLYYALCPLNVPLPPLSERMSDLPALCAFFAGLRGEGRSPVITAAAMDALQAHHWPGNVRELRHVIDYAVSMSQGGPILPSHLPTHLAGGVPIDSSGGLVAGGLDSVIHRWLDLELALPEQDRRSYDALLDHVESRMLAYLLELHDHRPTRLAAALRIHRGTLRQKLNRLGLQSQADSRDAGSGGEG